jgi:hypothetical protein
MDWLLLGITFLVTAWTAGEIYAYRARRRDHRFARRVRHWERRAAADAKWREVAGRGPAQ